MKTVIKLASVAVFGVMAMAVTGSVKPLSVGLVSEAKAGVQECKDRCIEKYHRCHAATGGAGDCLRAEYECKQDCEANAK